MSTKTNRTSRKIKLYQRNVSKKERDILIQILQSDEPFFRAKLIRYTSQKFVCRLEKARLIAPIEEEFDDYRARRIKNGRLFREF